ncbi:hypothetical protein Q7C36_020531 [Tachysurus vachellii]|uniref:Secreted protein n=1 Tax=Tachysurus vachellii TaxID=175792 RepID=A0AA88JB35_TACVA|nr:hypothetical protein Q7C36_020531 [Tachysurus vachellii]
MFSVPGIFWRLNWCTMLSDRFRSVRILLVLAVLLVPSSANDTVSAPRVYLSFKGLQGCCESSQSELLSSDGTTRGSSRGMGEILVEFGHGDANVADCGWMLM